MPPLQFWFTGAALYAGALFVASLFTLWFAWYRAADTEMQSANATAKAVAQDQRFTEARNQISALIEEGEQVDKEFISTKDANQLAAKSHGWSARVEAYLQTVDPAYAIRFRTAAPYPYVQVGMPSAGSADWQTLKGRLQVLTVFLQEIR